MKHFLFIILNFIGVSVFGQDSYKYFPDSIPVAAYQAIQHELAQGWNTWRSNSMTSHVLLPEGICVNVGLKDCRLFGEYYNRFYPSDEIQEPIDHVVRPGKVRSYDGTYTDMTVEIKGIHVRIQSATINGDLNLLVTPQKLPENIRPHLIIEAGMLWQRDGSVAYANDKQSLKVESKNKNLVVKTTTKSIQDLVIPTFSKYLSFELTSDQEIGIYVSANKDYSLSEIKAAVADGRQQVLKNAEKYSELDTLYLASQAILGWSTIYEPTHQRVITPSAGRWWNKRFQGFVLWGWDFTAYNFLLDNKELAYATLVETFRHQSPEGFFPNYYMGYDITSRDRSQPPVYSFAVRELYKKYQDRWLLEFTFDYLYRNVNWWVNHRTLDGYLCWGSDAIPLDWDAHTKQAATFESGLDNSPMFDEAVYNPESGLLEQADVGLTSLFLFDCEALLDIANKLGKKKEAAWLKARMKEYKASLASLWSEEAGIYLNKDLQTGEFNPRVSPTNLYPLLTGVPEPQQATTMIQNYFYNPVKFYGEYMIPSITRDDPAFKDQSYWRGRIWPPMNLFVYLGLQRYNFNEAAAELAEKSKNLIMKSYGDGHWVRENYHADHGDGTPCTNQCFGGSDSYYAWGSVFGIPSFIEKGYFPAMFSSDDQQGK